MREWYKLDNAGQIFPSSTTRKRMNNFRLSMVLNEVIDPNILEDAIKGVMPRFSCYNVKLKTGLFWYYLEKNKEYPKVKEESPFLLSPINSKENNGFLFRFSYYEKRITLEVFHALTDAFGALQFLKSVVYNYLVLSGKSIDSKGVALSYGERFEEIQDSFIRNYDKHIKTKYKDNKGLLIKGTKYEEDWISLINGKLDSDKLKEVANKYDTTITEFLVACLYQSAINTKNLFQKTKHPFQIFVPINLRKIFPSHTLRNFSLYITSKIDIYKETTFEEIIGVVKESFSKQLDVDLLKARVAANVNIEKNFFLRLVPLFIKSFLLKIGYNFIAGEANSLTISNLGKVELPPDLARYVERIQFQNIGSSKTPVNCASVTYNNEFNISFTSLIIERDIQKEFFRILSSFGLDIIIETNEVEVLK